MNIYNICLVSKFILAYLATFFLKMQPQPLYLMNKNILPTIIVRGFYEK
jgi:hypothetical protein